MASNINATIPVLGSELISEPIRNNFLHAKSEIEYLQNNSVFKNQPTQLGSVSNYVEITENGTLKLVGEATYFVDLIGATNNVVTVGPGVSINNAEQTLDFVTTANTLDYAWISFQLDHKWKLGSPIYPHIHWEQTQVNNPNWLLEYRWQKQNQLKTTNWTNYICNTPAFVWSSGTLNQISYGAGITPPSNYELSDIIQLRIIRDTTNTSGLFIGADPNNSICRITSMDIHIECDALGSNTQYSKN